MSKPPWTPGPWYVAMRASGDELDGPDGGEEYDRDCDEGGVFAVIYDEPCTLCVPWLEADARLIASAPALAEALHVLKLAAQHAADTLQDRIGHDAELDPESDEFAAIHGTIACIDNATNALKAAGWPEVSP